MHAVQLVLHSLRHYWRTHLATLLGVLTATAVIAGALIVGDSVRESLRAMSLARLGQVDLALTSRRLMREELARGVLEGDRTAGIATAAPVLVMPGGMSRTIRPEPGSSSTSARTLRAGGVNVYGVDERFWPLVSGEGSTGTAPQGNQVVLNRRAAAQLQAAVGDQVSLVVEIPAGIPRDALLGDRDQTVTEVLLEVTAIAEDVTTPGRFGLNPSQQLPLNAFVSLRTLQQQLGLSEVRASQRNPTPRAARVNALFLSATDRTAGAAAPAAVDLAAGATQALREKVRLVDLGLRVVLHPERGYVSLESEQMILEESLAEVAAATAKELGVSTSPVMVYLLNRLGTPDPTPENRKRGYSMYSVAAGIEFDTSPPFGPLEFLAGGPPANAAQTPDLAADPRAPIPVVLNDWLADDLAGDGGDGEMIAVGSDFSVRFHVVGDRGELPEDELTFRVSGIVKLAGPADDQGLTPRVEGVTDVESYSDWREPFPLQHDAITDRDDAYWKAHRATPKVFLGLADAQRLWRSRYGRLTSLRIAPGEGESLEELAERFSSALLARLTPQQTGLVVRPVKLQGLQAAAGTTDFAGLFVGFSFFLIAAAMLLIGLLFRLGVEQRIGEIGLLQAVGLTAGRVRWLFAGEGLTVALVGAAVGVPAAIGYAAIMLYGLKTWWNRAIGTQFLSLNVAADKVLVGAAAGVGVAAAAIVWSLWRTRNSSARDLLHGLLETSAGADSAREDGRRARRMMQWSLGLAAVLLGASLAGVIPGSEAFGGMSWPVVTFFVLGMSLLAGLLAALATWLSIDRATAVEGSGTPALARLALRNASRNRGRSLLTASLIASAAFVIVAVASGKRNPQQEAPVKSSGNGGFTLLAQASQPVLYDLNTPAGRLKLGLGESSLWSETFIAPFRMRPGEDASCLNLYRTELPTILGVPRDVLEEFDRQGRFRFAGTRAEHPWRLLEERPADGRIPVLGDLNTLMFSLKKGVGASIEVPAEALVDAGRSQCELEVAGMLDGSIFQGVLLMSEENFQALFPQIAGFRYFLIETPPERAVEASQVLETGLTDVGFDADSVAARLADFLAVQNTYLSTFQTLGGLGLLLGTIGLATVMLRNVLERRSEFALLRAVGLSNGNVLQLVLWENAALLGWGLASGGAAALLAMWPHLASTGADVPWRELGLLLAVVLAVGMLAPLAAVREVLQPRILQALRSE